MQHEAECEKRNERPDEIMPETERAPSATYCAYNVAHVFRSLQERAAHEENCPDRAEMEKKFN
jgi:hypothetical protein